MRISVKPVTVVVDNYHLSFGMRVAIEHRIEELHHVIRCLGGEISRDEQEELKELTRVLADLRNWI